MANAKQKISLNASRDIPFNKLVLSQSNVRRIKNGQTIENLAADIGRRGLLQSLNVRPVLDGEGSETGTFEVPAGGRRYRALELLVKQKRMAKTQPVPCVVTDANSVVPIEEDSLAENFHREDLHPLDMFRAFQTLHEQGATHEEIASRFFVTATFVQQRQRLAKASPKLLEVYEQDRITLDQLMAFTVTDDHARQEQVWQSLENSWSKEPHQIRRMLTETTVRATDRRALFVGIDAYVIGGGVVLRDLFEADNGGWLQDPVLLDRLVGDKLRAAADEVAAEGWKWIVIDVDLPYGHTHGLRVVPGSFIDPTDEEQASREALQKEYDDLESEHGEADELPEEVDRRLGDIEQALEALQNRPMIYDPVEIARAGVFVSIDRDGDLVVDRGYVRPEDDVTESIEGDSPETGSEGADATGSDAAVRGTTITMGAQSEPDEDDDDGIKPLPDRLLTELTAHRTVALRDAVAGDPHVALTLLLHGLVSERFRRHGASCLQASLLETHFPVQSADLRETSSAKAITERHESWAADIPSEDSALWDWLADLDDASRLALAVMAVAVWSFTELRQFLADRYRDSIRGMQGMDAFAESVRNDLSDFHPLQMIADFGNNLRDCKPYVRTDDSILGILEERDDIVCLPWFDAIANARNWPHAAQLTMDATWEAASGADVTILGLAVLAGACLLILLWVGLWRWIRVFGPYSSYIIVFGSVLLIPVAVSVVAFIFQWLAVVLFFVLGKALGFLALTLAYVGGVIATFAFLRSVGGTATTLESAYETVTSKGK